MKLLMYELNRIRVDSPRLESRVRLTATRLLVAKWSGFTRRFGEGATVLPSYYWGITCPTTKLVSKKCCQNQHVYAIVSPVYKVVLCG